MLSTNLYFLFCFNLSTSFGQVKISDEITGFYGGVSSKTVTLISENQLKLEKFNYNGAGPAVWFMIGKKPDEFEKENTKLNGIIIPDEKRSCDLLKKYKMQDIVITLHKGLKFTDFDYLSLFCIRYCHNFGYLALNSTDSMIPPAMSKSLPAECNQNPEPRCSSVPVSSGGGSIHS